MTSRIITAGSLAVYVAFILPLQTFVPNASNYDYSMLSLLPELAVVAVAIFVATGLLLAFSDRFLRGYLTPVVVALTALVYLNAGILSLGIPEINGELPSVLQSVARKAWDTLLAGGCLLTAVATFRWTRTWLHWVSAAILVLGLASLVDLRVDDRDTKGRGEGSFGTFASSAALADNLAYSPRRNILMLVLDATPGTIAAEVLSNDLALASHFPGFVCFPRNVGMHDRTERGVPGLFTGEYFEAAQNMSDYMMTSLGTNSFLRTYAAHGDAVYSMLDFFAYGLTTMPVVESSERVVARPYLVRRATEIPHLSLTDVVVFRMVPFIAKGPLLRHDIHNQRCQANGADYAFEHILYPKLAERPVAAEGRQVFAKFHTHGAHSPFCYELDGSPWVPRESELADVEVATSNCLVHASRLMDALREKGVYDRSFIVICADHGRVPSYEFPGNPRASAFLMVKPESESGPLVFSDAPTGHQNLARLMKAVCTKALSVKETIGLLSSEKRLYREYDRHTRECHDWIYGPDDSVSR